MNFDKAYKELLAGKKIRRKEWEAFLHLRMIGDTVKAFHAENIDFYSGSEILVSEDWTVVDGDDTKLTFIEALEELKLKKAITRETWREDTFMFVNNGNFVICKPVECEFMPTYACFCSADWEVMK